MRSLNVDSDYHFVSNWNCGGKGDECILLNVYLNDSGGRKETRVLFGRFTKSKSVFVFEKYTGTYTANFYLSELLQVNWKIQCLRESLCENINYNIPNTHRDRNKFQYIRDFPPRLGAIDREFRHMRLCFEKSEFEKPVLHLQIYSERIGSWTLLESFSFGLQELELIGAKLKEIQLHCSTFFTKRIKDGIEKNVSHY